jgi:hypothetical protein
MCSLKERDASPDVSFARENRGCRFREFFVERAKLFRRGNELFHGLLGGGHGADQNLENNPMQSSRHAPLDP